MSGVRETAKLIARRSGVSGGAAVRLGNSALLGNLAYSPDVCGFGKYITIDRGELLDNEIMAFVARLRRTLCEAAERE